MTPTQTQTQSKLQLLAAIEEAHPAPVVISERFIPQLFGSHLLMDQWVAFWELDTEAWTDPIYSLYDHRIGALAPIHWRSFSKPQSTTPELIFYETDDGL